MVNATVCNIRYMTGAGESVTSAKTTAAYDTHELEEISFTYQRIEAEHKKAQTTVIDDFFQTND